MSKMMAINQIEKQIDALSPVEQVQILERLVLHLKQLLLSQPTIAIPCIESKKTTEKLNDIFKAETSHLDSQLLNAQISSIGRDEWK